MFDVMAFGVGLICSVGVEDIIVMFSHIGAKSVIVEER
jgi:hypothetical protein